MSYETVNKVRADDGSLHDTVESARQHDVQRKKEARAMRVKGDLTDLIGQQLYSANTLARGWGEHPYTEGRPPTHEDIAEFILNEWASIAAIRQHL